MLNTANEVGSRKINNSWKLLYPVALLDFTTIVSWSSPTTGKFMVTGKMNHHYRPAYYIHFQLAEDVMNIG